jgi:hypothetical protein
MVKKVHLGIKKVRFGIKKQPSRSYVRKCCGCPHVNTSSRLTFAGDLFEQTVLDAFLEHSEFASRTVFSGTDARECCKNVSLALDLRGP